MIEKRNGAYVGTVTDLNDFRRDGIPSKPSDVVDKEFRPSMSGRS